MLDDLVIDTNVFLHAENFSEDRQKDARRLMDQLLKCETVLCIDAGFDLDESRNRSLIGAEYLRHLRFGSVGYALIQHLALSHRLKQIDRRNVAERARRKTNQLIANRRDRTFVSIATTNAERVLVSHDHRDFPRPKRRQIAKALRVDIVEAVDCCSRL